MKKNLNNSELFDNKNSNKSRENSFKINSDEFLNRIADPTLLTTIEEYHSRSDIDELIGPDEGISENLQKIDKFIQETCKKNAVHASIDTNIKIQKSMNTMKITTEEMASVAERRKAINESNQSNLTLKENLVSFYKANRLEVSDEEATEIVEKLMSGCEELTKKFNQAITEGFDAEKEIKVLTKDMDTATRFTYLVNAFCAVEALNASTFASEKNISESITKAITEYMDSTPFPTEADCDTIQKLLVEAISNNTLLLSGLEQAQELLSSATDSNTIVDFASNQYDDARTKAEMALAMWLEYTDGNISSIEEGALPEYIGVGAAAAVEEAKIMNDVATGRKTADYAVKCLKILGGIALFLLLAYTGILISATVGGLAAVALMSFFGTSTIACIASVIICIPLIWGLAQLGVNTGTYIMEKAGKAFDLVVKRLRESIFPKIKEIASNFLCWIENKIRGRQSSSQTIIATS